MPCSPKKLARCKSLLEGARHKSDMGRNVSHYFFSGYLTDFEHQGIYASSPLTIFLFAVSTIVVNCAFILFKICVPHIGLEADAVGFYLKLGMQPYLIDPGDMLLLVQMIAL